MSAWPRTGFRKPCTSTVALATSRGSPAVWLVWRRRRLVRAVRRKPRPCSERRPRCATRRLSSSYRVLRTRSRRCGARWATRRSTPRGSLAGRCRSTRSLTRTWSSRTQEHRVWRRCHEPSGRFGSDLDVGNNPLEVAGNQVPRCLIEERVVAWLPLRPFASGRGIDLDLDPVKCRARAPAVSGPDHEGVIAFTIDLQATAHLGCARPIVAGDTLGNLNT